MRLGFDPGGKLRRRHLAEAVAHDAQVRRSRGRLSDYDPGEMEEERCDDECARGSVFPPGEPRASAKEGADGRRELREASGRLKDANRLRFGAAILVDDERGKDERLDAVAAWGPRVLWELSVVDLTRPFRSLF